MKTGICVASLAAAVFGTGLDGAPAFAGVQRSASPTTAGKVPIVSVTGCLREQGTGNWMLVAATDPVPSTANAPQQRELPTTPLAGRNEYKLIGVAEFDLPTHKDHTVVVKGLFITATPVSRVNVTSVTTALSSCALAPGRQE